MNISTDIRFLCAVISSISFPGLLLSQAPNPPTNLNIAWSSQSCVVSWEYNGEAIYGFEVWAYADEDPSFGWGAVVGAAKRSYTYTSTDTGNWPESKIITIRIRSIIDNGGWNERVYSDYVYVATSKGSSGLDGLNYFETDEMLIFEFDQKLFQGEPSASVLATLTEYTANLAEDYATSYSLKAGIDWSTVAVSVLQSFWEDYLRSVNPVVYPLVLNPPLEAFEEEAVVANSKISLGFIADLTDSGTNLDKFEVVLSQPMPFAYEFGEKYRYAGYGDLLREGNVYLCVFKDDYTVPNYRWAANTLYFAIFVGEVVAGGTNISYQRNIPVATDDPPTLDSLLGKSYYIHFPWVYIEGIESWTVVYPINEDSYWIYDYDMRGWLYCAVGVHPWRYFLTVDPLGEKWDGWIYYYGDPISKVSLERWFYSKTMDDYFQVKDMY